MDADVGWRSWSVCSTLSHPTSGTCSTSRWSGFFSTRPAGSKGTGEGVQSLPNAHPLAPCSCCTSPCTAGQGWALPPLAWRATCLFYLRPDQEVLLTLLSVASTRRAADTLICGQTKRCYWHSYLWPDQEVLLTLLSVASTRRAADTLICGQHKACCWHLSVASTRRAADTLICGQTKRCYWHSYLWPAQGVLLTLLSVASTRHAADTYLWPAQGVLLTLLSVASTKRHAADTLICDQQKVCCWHF